MATWTDPNGTVHAVDVSSSLAILVCERHHLRDTPFGSRVTLTHIGAKDERFSPHERVGVTCMACLAEGPHGDGVPELMTCDACGQLWRELDEKLVPYDRDELDALGSFRVLKPGTLPKCSRCP